MKYPIMLWCTLALGCGATDPPEVPVTNTWADARMAPVLEAQDHRDGKALLVLLADTSAAVREAAALAFASVQDSMAREGLVAALGDPQASVRLAAARALSFVADTNIVLALTAQALKETDPKVAERFYESSFRALTRVRPDQDVQGLIDVFRKSTGYQRAVVADALRRSPKEKLLPAERAYVERLLQEREPYVKMLLIAGMKNFSDTLALKAITPLLHDPDPIIRVNALRAFAVMGNEQVEHALLEAVRDGSSAVRSTAVELLQQRTAVPGDACWAAGQEIQDVMVKIPLYGLAVKFGDEGTRNGSSAVLAEMWAQDADPYVRAALIAARAPTVGTDTLLAWMNGPRPAVERQAAFTGLVAHVRGIMERTRYASRKDRFAQLAEVLRAAFRSKDAGLIAAAAEELAHAEADAIAWALDSATGRAAWESLHPVRDLEARRALAQAIAKRDGLPAPVPAPPRYDHPIDRARLVTLEEGRRYRIVTTKGDIVIAIEPGAAPGSCVAFDSLVAAGFYNGRYFHRVVPNFVAQGGCPRGDGYGAMDWSLRTEIGPAGFVAGAVGLASAGRDTESCQFFITLAPAPHLDGRYTRFAHVVSGLDVASKLEVGDAMLRVARAEQ